MVTFPTYQRQQGLGGGATASFASEGAMTAPARALAGAGNALEGVGDVLAQRQQQVQNTQDDVWFSKARAESTLALTTYQRDMQQQATGDAKDYVPNVRGRFEQERQTRLQQAPSPRAQAMFDEWSASYDATLAVDAGQFAAQSAIAQRTASFSEAVIAHSQTVLAEPSSYDSVYRRAMDDLEGARQWMTPEQEVTARQAIERELQLARAQGEIQRDPKAFLESIGVSDKPEGATAYREAIASIESAGSGDYAAIGPDHPTLGRALGRYQIMEANIGPWSRKHLGRTVSVSEFMANDDIQDAIFDAEFGSYVAKYGLEGAAQAWFAGEGGVGKVDRQDSLGTNVGSYGQKFLDALGQQTATGPNVAGNPRFTSLDNGDVLSLNQQAQASFASQMRQEAAQQTASMAALKGQFELGIATGDTSVTEQAIISSGLAPSDQATLINSLNSKNADGRMAQDAITRLNSGGSFNAYSSDDKKAVGLAFDAIVGGASILTDRGAQAALGTIYRDSGIVPAGAVRQLRAGLNSSNAQDVAAAGLVASDLAQMNRGGLAAVEGGGEITDAAVMYNHLTGSLGLTPEQAGRRMIDLKDPEKVRQREALLKTEAAKNLIEGVSANDIASSFDDSLLGWRSNPELGATPMARAAMVGEYRSILTESLVEAAGDEELARSLADERFAARHGASSLYVGGDGVIVRNPPEKAYPAGPDGTHGYLKEQAIAALAAEGVTTGNVWFQPDELTESDIRAGRPPRYRIFYEEDGVIQQYSQPFFAEPPVTGAPDFSDNRQRMLDNRQQVEQGRDRDATLDTFLAGPTQLPRLEVQEAQ